MKKSILEMVNESVEGLYDAGLVDAATRDEFKAICLTPIEKLSPVEIKSLRLLEEMSQSLFAIYQPNS